MNRLKINHAAVWIAVVVTSILGYLWYDPFFGDQWMAYVGFDRAYAEANPPSTAVWISNLVATVIPLYVLAWLFTRLDVKSAMEGAGIALAITFSFVFLTIMVQNLFAENPYGLSWISGGLPMLSTTLAGALFGGWRKYT